MLDHRGLLISLLDKVDTISQQFVIAGYHRLVSTYTPAIYGLVTLTIIFFGYGLLMGWIHTPMQSFTKRIFLIGFVVMLATHWELFSNYIYVLFTKAPNEIATQLIESIPNSPVQNQEGVNGALQKAFYDGIYFAKATWERGGATNWSPYLWAVVMYLMIFILSGFALIELIVAKFGLAIYIVLAPLMIPMVLFPATKSALFDGWLRHMIGFALIPIYVTSAIALKLMLMVSVQEDIQQAIQNDQLTITEIVPYILYSFISVGLLWKATQMAVGTAGGLSASIADNFHRMANKGFNNLKQMMPGSKGSSGETHFHISGTGNEVNFKTHQSTQPPK